MNSRKLIALGGGLLLGVAGAVKADTTPSNAELQSQVQALKDQVNRLEGKQSQDWLNEQRAAEVKAMVKDVLADADTRASLMANGMTAGHNGQHFFLASENNDFQLNIGGLIQARADYDHRRNAVKAVDASTGDAIGARDSSSGVEVARIEVDLWGHVVNPEWTYFLRFEQDHGETAGVPLAWVGYQATDTVNIRMGRYKGVFMHESLVDDMYGQAVERSVTEGIFGEGYVQGVTAEWDVTDMVRLQASIDNGPHSGDLGSQTFFGNSRTNLAYNGSGDDISATGRADVKVMGDWKEYTDYAAWSDQETAVFVGAAINYTVGETGNNGVPVTTTNPTPPPATITTITGSGDNTKDLRWTVDADAKMAGFDLSAAFVYDYLGHDNATPALPAGRAGEWYAWEVQGGYMVIPDKFDVFARYEWIDLKGSITESHPEFVTVGTNYYIARHRVKLTVDATYAFVALPSAGPTTIANTDLLASSHSDEILLRGQVQLMF
jgi:hypothetical protein